MGSNKTKSGSFLDNNNNNNNSGSDKYSNKLTDRFNIKKVIPSVCFTCDYTIANGQLNKIS